jgi:RecB family endonuclease NucS
LKQIDEKTMEDLIASNPERYLKESGLKLVDRQLRVGPYRFDLIFEDRTGAKLIVEIQKGTLDRDHTYKILDYYDAYKELNPREFVEVMLVANIIPIERKQRLSSRGISYREICDFSR